MIRKKLIAIFAVTAMVAMVHTAQAALVINGTATWTSVSSLQTVQVDYEVDLIGALYTYNYQIRPTGGTSLIEAFEVDVSTALAGVALAAPTTADIFVTGTGISGSPTVGTLNIANVNWSISGGVLAGLESAVVAFSSPLPFIWGTGSAIDGVNGPWSATYPGATLVPVPAVPEPTTMIAGALLLLPFGASTLRILRKRQTA